MKKLLLLLLFIPFLPSGFAQNNVNVDNLRFALTYRALPLKPLNPMFFYYGVRINVPNRIAQFIDIDVLLRKLAIEG